MVYKYLHAKPALDAYSPESSQQRPLEFYFHLINQSRKRVETIISFKILRLIMMKMDDEKTSTQLWLLPYRITFALVIAVGMAINYKLYCNVMKETPGEKGKVFQQIMKNYTRMQVFGFGFVWIWMTALLSIVSLNYNFMISPCIWLLTLFT